jgi:uncharacterized membrane protein YjgN (DUF898 family)
MTIAEAVGAPPAPAAPSAPLTPPPGVGRARFFGREGEFFALLARGALLLMVTLGIYRFWLTTDVRRYLWGHTEIAGDGLEYTGTARELLIGFLMAIVLLVPINILLFIGTLMPDLLPYAGALGAVLLALLGQFAVFRARRYRLTRTVHRGVRFFQTGAGWRYSLLSNAWSVVIVLTLGLAYPWATASLERYKMRHTFFGNLSGQFVGSGTRLFLRGILLWLLILGPFAAGLAFAAATVDWSALAAAVLSGLAGFERLEKSPSTLLAAGFLTMASAWAIFAAVVFYPLFRAIVMRWWLSGLRLGGVASQSQLRTGQIYAVYGRFLWFAFLFSLFSSVVAGFLFGLYTVAAKDLGLSGEVAEISVIVLGLAGYVAMMLGYSTIYQATVTIRFWKLSFETTDLTGLEALDGVAARGEASGAFGEGLADALDVGGL